MLRFIEQNWFLILFVVGMCAMHFGRRGGLAGHGGMGGCGGHAGHSTHSGRDDHPGYDHHPGYDDHVGHSTSDHTYPDAHGPTRPADDAQPGVRDSNRWAPQDATGPQDRTGAAAGREPE